MDCRVCYLMRTLRQNLTDHSHREFQFCGSWTLFAWPVSDFVLLDMPQAGPLHGTLLCTSQAGTVGIISLSEMEQ